MKIKLSPGVLRPGSLLLTCSSHEDRCLGLLSATGSWAPDRAVLFHYDDVNPRREKNHSSMLAALRSRGVGALAELQFTEANAAKSLNDNMQRLRGVLAASFHSQAIVLDMSVFTKRHLLMMLRWLDDADCWDRLTIVYSEPDDYEVSEIIPLSFGLASLQHIPGFSACSDFSRPVHLVLFLGYEGDRALAVYEHVEPMVTTLVVPDPPYRPHWAGRTEKFNADLLAIVGHALTQKVDAVDPDATHAALMRVLGPPNGRGGRAKIICPLGTKPQTLGVYCYVRTCTDPPAIIYAGPARHNHGFYSYGIGSTWLLKQGTV